VFLSTGCSQVNSLSQQELASRLTLLYQPCDPSSWSLPLAHSRVTILDVRARDFCMTVACQGRQLTGDVGESLAIHRVMRRQRFLRCTGGNFYGGTRPRSRFVGDIMGLPCIAGSSKRVWTTAQAMLKDSGYFPFLSHHDEVSMHLQVHLRANGAFIG
jgi:hypothetical protein